LDADGSGSITLYEFVDGKYNDVSMKGVAAGPVKKALR
jgi:hypothetical protein